MVDVQLLNRFRSRFEAQNVPNMLQHEAPDRHTIMPKSKLCKNIKFLKNFDACMAPPNQKNLEKRYKGMQIQGFQSVCKKDIPQASKYPNI